MKELGINNTAIKHISEEKNMLNKCNNVVTLQDFKRKTVYFELIRSRIALFTLNSQNVQNNYCVNSLKKVKF